MIKILEGIKVADFTAFASGPACAKLLAEYGADDVLVEPLKGINGSRGLHYVDFFNGNKRSLAVDLKTPEGIEAARKLITKSDVFLTNYRAKALKSLGLTYEDVKAINPTIIYGAISGWGDKGPMKDMPAYDTTAFWTRTGMWRDIMDKDAVMATPPSSIGDTILGMALAMGVLGGLYYRERTGKGLNITSSLYALGLYLNIDTISEVQHGTVRPGSRKSPVRALLNTYPCKDGWVTLTSLKFDSEWPKILTAIGREDLIGDPRWTCYEDTMNDKSAEVVALLDSWFTTVTCEEAVARFAQFDLALSRIGGTEEILHDPQALENKYLFPLHDFWGNDVMMPASPVRFGDEDLGEYRIMPRIGQDTIDVMKELGYTEEQIQDYDARKIVFAEFDGKRVPVTPPRRGDEK